MLDEGVANVDGAEDEGVESTTDPGVPGDKIDPAGVEGGTETGVVEDSSDIGVVGGSGVFGAADEVGEDGVEGGREEKRRQVAAYSYISSSEAKGESQISWLASKPRKPRIS